MRLKNKRKIKLFFIIALSFIFISNLNKKNTDFKMNDILENKDFIQNIQNIPISVIAPASTLDNEKIQYLQNQNILNLKLPKNLSSQLIPFHSNTDEERFDQIKRAINDKSKIIWSLRGGYGSARLYENLLKLKKPNQDKVFIGYSDLTFLHLFFIQNWNWKTIHGSTLSDLFNKEKDSKNFSNIVEIISGNIKEITYTNIEPLNELAKSSQEVYGKLVGGNLEILSSSLGTNWQINGKNKIIFIEDIGAKGYVVDRNLIHLYQAKIFQNAKAILLGSFTNSDENIEFTIKRFANEVNIPVFKSNQFGHGNKNYPLVLNENITISPQKKIITLNLGDDFKNILKPNNNDYMAIR